MQVQPLPLKWTGDSTFPRRGTGKPASKAGRKGNKLRAECGDAPSRWSWSAQAKVRLKRRHADPAKRLTSWPKMGIVSFGHVVMRNVVSTRIERRGVKYRPTTTPNGHSERDNPLLALAPLCPPPDRGDERR